MLFACGLNSILSPMAASLFSHLIGAAVPVRSAGVQTAELDPFAVATMAEIGVDIAAHRPVTFEELEDLEGLDFDLIVTLSPKAHHKAMELTHRLPAQIEYWPTPDPAVIEVYLGTEHELARAASGMAPVRAGRILSDGRDITGMPPTTR